MCCAFEVRKGYHYRSTDYVAGRVEFHFVARLHEGCFALAASPSLTRRIDSRAVTTSREPSATT